MEVDVDMGDVGVSLDIFAHRVGETTEQATLRYGVAAARAVSKATPPKVTKKRDLKEKTIAQMRRVVEPVPANYYKKLRKSRRPSVKLGSRWFTIGQDRFLDTPQAIWRAIERNRDRRGRTRFLIGSQKFVCKQADFNAVVKSRVLLWGVGKGSWLGAGQKIAAAQRGLNRNTIGKNVPAMAKRHMSKGQGRKMGGGDQTSVILDGATEALTQRDIETALTIARKAVWAYYRGELRRMSR